MTKAEFKSRMHSYRVALKKAMFCGKNKFIAVLSSDPFLKSCLRPRYHPVVSRNVMMHLFTIGGLDSVRHIDQVEIKYN